MQQMQQLEQQLAREEERKVGAKVTLMLHVTHKEYARVTACGFVDNVACVQMVTSFISPSPALVSLTSPPTSFHEFMLSFSSHPVTSAGLLMSLITPGLQ